MRKMTMTRRQPLPALLYLLHPCSRMPIREALLVSIMMGLAGCGGGAATQENPIITPPTQQGYSGPPAATADVQAFSLNLWDKITPENRCGGCHAAGGQTPT